jgi:hypothetical protein
MNTELINSIKMFEQVAIQSKNQAKKLERDLYNAIITLTNLKQEIWKDVKDYEGIYQISNFGDVRNIKTSRILKPTNDSTGYKCIDLCCDGKRKHMRIHRLVAINFIPNDENKQCVDHIDNDRVNNKIDNLRWCTIQENNINTSISKRNISGSKGVSFVKRLNKWRAHIKINRKPIHLGYFTNIDDAIKARKDKAKELFGEFINACEL